MKRKNGRLPRIAVTFKRQPELYDRLRQEADREHRTDSEQVAYIVSKYFSTVEEAKSAYGSPPQNSGGTKRN